MRIPVRPRHVLNAALSIFLVVAVAAMRSPVGAAAPQAAAQPQRSVAEGVYTEAQRTRGQPSTPPSAPTATRRICREATLRPRCPGSSSSAAWKGTTVGELFEKIRTMPPTSPGKLNPQQSADVLAFVLSKNSFRPVQTELASDVAALKSIRFEGGQASADACSRFRTVRSSTACTRKSRAGEARATYGRGVRELPRGHARPERTSCRHSPVRIFSANGRGRPPASSSSGSARRCRKPARKPQPAAIRGYRRAHLQPEQISRRTDAARCRRWPR